MFSLTAYNNYFEVLSRQHVLLKHTEKLPRFFRMKRDVTTKLEKAGDVICVLETPDWNYFDNQADNFMKDKTGAFSIMKRCKVDDFIGQDEAVDLCEQISEQFMAKMKADNRNYDDQKFGQLDINTFSAFKVGPVYDGFYGVRVEFKFSDHISLCVDQSQWNFNLVG
jgi:hypothetical protein